MLRTSVPQAGSASRETGDLDATGIQGEGPVVAEGGLGGSRLVIYYSGVEPDDVSVKEAEEIDFEEFLLRLDTRSSAFMAMKPRDEIIK